jgi:NADPH-dependent curcumin reductase CurA
MSDLQNRQLKLTQRPVGMPKASDFTLETSPVRAPGEGEVLVKALYASLDPAMRGWMSDARSYLPPVGLGEVMRALVGGRVVESRHPALRAGDYVTGSTGLQEYAVVDGAQLNKVDVKAAPLSKHMAVLGMPGLTAYFGLLDIGALKDGETVVVSGAAGAVGSIVGQIAKIKGCRVVGIAGGERKCHHLVDELGFDAAIDYRSEDVNRRLKELCPDRIDVYFDNVGGDILDAALACLNRNGRVVLCGAISQYNATEGVTGPKNYLSLLVNRGRMQGFLVFDFMARYGEGISAMSAWLEEGQLKSTEDIADGGLEAFTSVFERLFTGENFGKLILKVADDEPA